jgi:ABC-2 type transport system ATP-binding protein
MVDLRFGEGGILPAATGRLLPFMSVIRLVDLTKRFGSRIALDHLSVEFPGGAMGLLGPNGAGKTTLLKILLGLTRPTEGRAEVLGRNATKFSLDVRRRVGYMPEADCYIPGLTGVRAVAFAGELTGLPRRIALTRAHEVLYYVGLDESRYRRVDEYSQGMRQRLRLAQALVHDPEVVFLDEPTSGLDPRGREEMIALIRDLAEAHGKHLLLSTHLLADVEEVCRRVVVLRSGRLAAQGTLEELLERDAEKYEARIVGDVSAVTARLARDGVEVVEVAGDRVVVRVAEGTLPLFGAAAAESAQVRELRPLTHTLEEAFFAAVDAGGEG